MIRKDDVVTDDSALQIVTDRYSRWAKMLMTGTFAEMQELLADDFRMTSYIVMGPALDKQRFLEVGQQVEKAELTFRTIWAKAVGSIIVSRVTLDVREEFKADLGPGMPSSAEVTRMLSGHRLAYASAWRRSASGAWQCLHHHMFGTVD